MAVFAVIVFLAASFRASEGFRTEKEIDLLWKTVEPFGEHHYVFVIGDPEPHLKQKIWDSEWPLHMFLALETEKFRKVNCSEPFEWPRHQFKISAERRPFIFIILNPSLNETKTILSVLRGTVTDCPTELKMGKYHSENKFLFAFSKDQINKETRGAIFSDKEVMAHPNVAVVSPERETVLAVTRFNIYEDKLDTELFDPNSGQKSPLELFKPFNMKGYVFKVSLMPFAFWSTVDYHPSPPDGRRVFTNQSGIPTPFPSVLLQGSDVTTLATLCEKLDCRMEFLNPPDFAWGLVGKDSLSGSYKDLREDVVDIIAGCHMINNEREQVGVGSFVHQYPMFTSTVSKSPVPVRTVFTLLRAYDLTTWILIVVFLLAFPIFLAIVSKAEDEITSEKMYWSKLDNSYWYVFGVFLGETMISSDRASDAVRMMACEWFIFAFLITTTYGGNLRAFLLTPQLSESIETVDEVITSGMPWKVVIYGDEGQSWNENHTNPAVRYYWANKVPMKFTEFPFEAIKEVHEEKALFIDYSSVVETAIPAAFDKTFYSEATTGIKISSRFFDDAEQNWSNVPWTFYFQRRSPWLKRFNWYLMAAEQGGLRDEWINRNKRDMINKFRKTVTEHLVYTPPEVEIKMAMEDHQSIIVLYFAILAGTVLLFLGEIWPYVKAFHQEKVKTSRWCPGGGAPRFRGWFGGGGKKIEDI